MSINVSSTSNGLQRYNCAYAEVSFYMGTSIVALKVLLLLPLSTFVLCLGHHRWRRQRSSKPATHSDIFTYNAAAMELIYVLGNFCTYGGICTNNIPIIEAGGYVSSVVIYGEILLHVLTCVERYLAVVHPITYLGLRNARGVRIRNICIGCVWLTSFALIVAAAVTSPNSVAIQLLCVSVFSTIVISFCSLSVLCVLIRPGPGDRDGSKKQVDQSKLRAFHTIAVISVAVWLWLFGLFVITAADMSPLLTNDAGCLLGMITGWFNLPSSLVSPLLFLHRAGKLSCCC